MNMDDFEQKLAQQEIRPIPGEWRDAILDAVSKETEPAATRVGLPEPWWRNLLWPSPRAWSGLAAAWVAILILNSGAGETPVKTTPTEARTLASCPDWSKAMAEQKSLKAELLGLSESPKSEKQEKPQPRSDAGTNRFRALGLV